MIKQAIADDAEVLGTLDRTWLILSLELAAILAVLLLVVLFLYWRNYRRRLKMAHKLMEHADQIANQATETWAMHVGAVLPDVTLDDEHRKAFRHRSRELSEKLAAPWLKPSENGLLDALGSIHRIRNEDLHHWVATVRDMMAHQPAPAAVASDDDSAAIKRLQKQLNATENREKTLNNQLQEALQTIAKLVNEYGRGKENQPSATADNILRTLTFLAATKAGMTEAQAAEQTLDQLPPDQDEADGADNAAQTAQGQANSDGLDDIDQLLDDQSDDAPQPEAPEEASEEPAATEAVEDDDIDALLEQAQADKMAAPQTDDQPDQPEDEQAPTGAADEDRRERSRGHRRPDRTRIRRQQQGNRRDQLNSSGAERRKRRGRSRVRQSGRN